MTILFDRVLRHRCPNDVRALLPPDYDWFPVTEQLGSIREQIRAALWQFGGVIHASARYLRVDTRRLRRYVHEIDVSLLDDIARINAALVEYADSVLSGRDAPEPPVESPGVVYLSARSRR